VLTVSIEDRRSIGDDCKKGRSLVVEIEFNKGLVSMLGHSLFVFGVVVPALSLFVVLLFALPLVKLALGLFVRRRFS